ncbi:hypothetical protein [Dyadobacter sp. CY312]|uniref:hypothetical protein n=1 Tax=Dyadobacter sp. CY312 TaxID=2907303 RepID=UPI001F4665E3|nr:hypothetical protein [Dyadobacter sp. CY312]MCE7044440.1 hypothetical protein [Dyadobacter sp. CY312]
MNTIIGFSTVQVVGFVLLLTGLFVRLLIGKRRFDRRGVGGMQHFRSYWTALILTFIEWVAGIVSLMMILSGLLLLLVECYNHSKI